MFIWEITKCVWDSERMTSQQNIGKVEEASSESGWFVVVVPPVPVSEDDPQPSTAWGICQDAPEQAEAEGAPHRHQGEAKVRQREAGDRGRAEAGHVEDVFLVTTSNSSTNGKILLVMKTNDIGIESVKIQVLKHSRSVWVPSREWGAEDVGR